MKVYSKRQVDLAIENALNSFGHGIKQSCIQSVKDALDSIVIKKDQSLFKSLQQRIETIEMDLLQAQTLRPIPTPKQTNGRKKMVKRLNEAT